MITLLFLGTANAAEPHFSYPKLLTANGYGVTVFNGGNDGGAVLDVFSDHLYQQYSEDSEPVRDLLYDTYFGLRVDGESGWLTEAEDYRIVPGTNVVEVDRSRSGLGITEYAFAPMELEGPAVVHLLKVSSDTPTDVALFSLQNFQVGDTTNENESVWVEDGRAIIQGSNTGLTMSLIPLVSPTHIDCSPNNPYYAVNEGWDLADCAGGSGDDQVAGFQWSQTVDGELWVGAVYAFSAEWDTSTMPALVEGWVSGRSPSELVDAELSWWADWHAQGEAPVTMSEDETLVYQQALAFMKMGQVRESGDAYGQILASLPASAPVGGFQHIWNISWVRDGAYAIRGLTEAGHCEEAKAFLEFQIQPGKTGEWTSYVGGMDHALSICRIYANGDEWTDVDQDGPNIEFDNFGLYLWAAGEYVERCDDPQFINDHHEALFDQTADVLVRLREPTNGLITADSSIWEEHWNGNQKHFTYTSQWAVRGLREAAEMADQYGDSRGDEYREEANGIREAIVEHLVREDGVLVGNLEEHERGEPAMDLAAVDAFNNGTLDAQSASYEASMDAWERDLGVPTGPGFARNDDGDLYDQQEWIMIDLRVAESLRRACREDEAAEIEDWITEHAVLNNLIIPELLEPSTADYSGPAPMMGFGSGLYVLEMHQREADLCTFVDDGDGGDDTGADPGLPPDDECGCAAAPSTGGAWFVLLGLLFLRRRA